MKKVHFPRLLAAALFLCLVGPGAKPAGAQEQGAVDAASFFSGTVVSLDPGKVAVTRTILGKSPETRTFIINAQTKVEGQLKAKARVTVRFAASDEGDVAISIVVRDGMPRRSK